MNYEFINFDDNKYVTENANVKKGLTLENVAWAFGFSETAIEFYWHPLTWLSHMLDTQLFGVNPAWHHFTSLLLHIANVLLLFFILYATTHKPWPCFFVSAIFALHPINVDSVVWIAERKNVLSSFFWMLTLLAYVYYSKQPGLKRYLLVVFSFVLGMLSKPMLVTIPCVLLLMDYWPLARMQLFTPDPVKQDFGASTTIPAAKPLKLVLEKLPLFALSFFFTGISIYSVHIGNQIVSSESIPMALRLQNALVSYVKYIGKMIWPHDFAIFYPFPEAIALWQVIAAAALLIGITASAVILIKRAPYVIIGWLWYLGTMFPVIGVFQQGRWPEMADRWAYVPTIGLFIIAAWGGTALLARLPKFKPVTIALVAGIVCALIPITRHQAGYWQNSRTLFAHALDVTDNNHVAHFNLGAFLADNGDIDRAIKHYRRSLEIKQSDEVQSNLGSALAEKGKIEEAVEHLETALQINPRNPRALNNMGNVQIQKGNPEAAIKYFKQALQEAVDSKQIQNNLGNAMIKVGRYEQAVSHFEAVLKNDPGHVQANINMGVAMARLNRVDEAIAHYRRAIAAAPENAEAHNNLGVLLLRQKRYQNAKAQFQAALRYRPEYASARANLDKLNKMLTNRQNIEHQLKQRLERNPDSAERFYKLGVFYHKSDNSDKAIENYEKALDLDSNHHAALFNLGVLLASEQRYKRASRIFERLVKIQPDNSLIYYNLACISARREKPKTAIKWLQKSIDHGYRNWEKLKTDPDLAAVRSSPEYQLFIKPRIDELANK